MEQGLALLFPVFLGLLQRAQGEQGRGLGPREGSQRGGAQSGGRGGGPYGVGVSEEARPGAGGWGGCWGWERGRG